MNIKNEISKQITIKKKSSNFKSLKFDLFYLLHPYLQGTNLFYELLRTVSINQLVF